MLGVLDSNLKSVALRVSLFEFYIRVQEEIVLGREISAPILFSKYMTWRALHILSWNKQRLPALHIAILIKIFRNPEKRWGRRGRLPPTIRKLFMRAGIAGRQAVKTADRRLS
jgi:hypothetical protein